MNNIGRATSLRIESFEQKAAALDSKIGKLEGREAKQGITKADSKKIAELCATLITSFNKLEAEDQKVAAPTLQRAISQVMAKNPGSKKLDKLILKVEIQIKELLGTSSQKAVSNAIPAASTAITSQLRDYNSYKDQKKVIVSNAKALLAAFSQDKINKHIEQKMGFPLATVKSTHETFRALDKKLNMLVFQLKQEATSEGKEIIRERIALLQKGKEQISKEIGPAMEMAVQLYGAHAEISEKIVQTEGKIQSFEQELVKGAAGDIAKLSQLQTAVNLNVNYMSDLSLGLLDMIKGQIGLPKPPEKPPSAQAPKMATYPPPPDPKKMSKKAYEVQRDEIYPGRIAEIKEKYTNAMAAYILADKAQEKMFNEATQAYKTQNPSFDAIQSLKNSLNAASGKPPELNDISNPLGILFQAFDQSK